MLGDDARAMDAPAFLGGSMSNAALATRPNLILGPQPKATVLLLEIAIRTPKDVPPPSIISDGLVLHFDIANPACYPGSGLAFTDLSGNGNHGTLTGPTNIADGAINFDGTTNLTTTTLISIPQSFTVGVWFRTSAALGRKLIGLETQQINVSAFYDRHFYVDTAGQLRWGQGHPGDGTFTFVYGNVIDYEWRYAVVSFNNGAMLLSMNGQVIGNVSTGAQPFNGYWRIGGQTLGGWPSANSGFFVGSIAAVEIYNRSLVIAEIKQNFNINRERLGL